jgi:hypothetical protein
LFAAKAMTGNKGHKVPAIPLDRVIKSLKRDHRIKE